MTTSSDFREGDIDVSDPNEKAWRESAVRIRTAEFGLELGAAFRHDGKGGMMVDVVMEASADADRERAQSYVVFQLGEKVMRSR